LEDCPVIRRWIKALFLVLLLLWPPLAGYAEFINGDLFLVGVLNYCSDAGSTDAYACTPADTRLTAYVDGSLYGFKANTINTGAASFNYNGLGAKTIKKPVGGVTTDLATGDIRPGQRVLLQYDLANDIFQMLSQLGNAPSGTVNLATDVGTSDLLYANLTPATAASRLLGRGSAAGAGDWQEVTLAANELAMSGTALGVGPNIAKLDASNTWADGVKQTFNPNATNAGLNVGAQAGNPSTLANGDLWYDSTGNALQARVNNATVTLGAAGGGVTASGTPTAGQLGQWVSSSSIKGVTSAIQVAGAATGGLGTGAQPWTGWEALFSGGGVANTAYYFAPGIYQFSTTITLSADSMAWIGAGKQTSVLQYNGTSTGILVSAGAATMNRFQMQGFGFRAGDTANTKIILDLRDISNALFRDLDFGSGSDVVGGTGSICLRTQGRELTTFNNISTRCEKAIVIADNPNSSIDIDQFHFSDLYLNSFWAYPLVTINSGVNLTNLTIDGFNSWVGGTYGIFWNDTTSAQASLNLMLRNIRYEQGNGTTGWLFYLHHNYSLQNVIIENTYNCCVMNHIHLHNASFVTIRHSIFTVNNKINIEADSTVARLILDQVWLACSGCTDNITMPQFVWSLGDWYRRWDNTARVFTVPNMALQGPTSGVITIQPQAAAGTYNFNLPTTAGTTGQCLVSQGGGSTAMTWGACSGGGVTLVATGTSALATGAIASTACTTTTTTATGTATTDVISFTPNADITAVTGYSAVTTGGLAIYPFPTTNNVNFRVCNPTASSITPGAVTLNWKVIR
jgi:hypothetical protein